MAQVRQRVSRVEGGVTVGGMGVDVLNEAQWTMVPAMRVEGLMLGYRDREQMGRETEPAAAARPSHLVCEIDRRRGLPIYNPMRIEPR